MEEYPVARRQQTVTDRASSWRWRVPVRAAGVSVGCPAAPASFAITQEAAPGNAGNGSPRTLSVFSLFWEGCGDPLQVLPVRGPAYPLSVCWCSCGCRCSLRVALRRPWQPWWWLVPATRTRAPATVPGRVSGCLVSTAGSPTSSGAARRPGEVSAPGLAVLLGRCAGWLPPVAWLWCSTGLPFPALPLNSPAHRSSSQPRQHRQQAPAASPTKKSLPGKRAKDPLPPLPVPRRESPVVVVAVPPRRPRLAGTDASTAPPLPPTPCPGGFVQNPSSERPPTRLQSETKHYGVRQDLARTVQRISIKVLPAR
jgi:hypothetical protein